MEIKGIILIDRAKSLSPNFKEYILCESGLVICTNNPELIIFGKGGCRIKDPKAVIVFQPNQKELEKLYESVQVL